MRTTIDSAGRLVIPKDLRKEADLRPGDALEIQCREGRIEILPVPLPVRLAREGSLIVAVPMRDAEPLTHETVERTRRALVRAELGRFLKQGHLSATPVES